MAMDLGWLSVVVSKHFGTDNLDAIFDNFAPNLSAMISNIFSNTNKMQGSLEYQSELMGDVKRELQDIRLHSSEAYWKGRFEEEQKKVADLQKQLEESQANLKKVYGYYDELVDSHNAVMKHLKKIESAVKVDE